MGAFLDKDPWYILFFVEGVILILLSLLKSIYQIYASLAIGQLQISTECYWPLALISG